MTIRTSLARRVIIVFTAAGLLLASAPLPVRAAPRRQVIGNVVPFLGVFVGWSHRNRVYRDAESFIADRNRYYDALRDTARRQLAEREIAGLRTSQVAAYTKLVALIERNRQAEVAQAEARKREARQAFHRRLESVLLQRILGTGTLQRLFGALSRGVNSSQGLLDEALNKVSGGGGGFLAEIERVRKIARDVESVAGIVGGKTGNGLRRTAGRIAATIERPQQLIQADLERVRQEIGELGATIDALARSGRTPSAGALAEGLLLRPPGGSDDPAVEAVSAILSRLAVGDGSLRDQARAAIQAGFVGRCSTFVNEFRQALARLEESPDAAEASSAASACNPVDVEQLAQTTSDGAAADVPIPEGRCGLTGDGDFVIENLVASNTGGSCEGDVYPFGMSSEPLLAYLAVAGRWVTTSETTWTWQATQDLNGAIVDATAQTMGDSLEIDVAVTAPPSGNSFLPVPGRGNGLALAVMLPLLPLAMKFSPKKRRRLIVAAVTLLSLLLMAQSCEVYGTFSGRYTFPLPDEGFACEVAPDNPNLAEMPGSRGLVSMELTVADEDGANTCSVSGTAGGLGVLKRDGVYTEDMLQ
ncbi:MAG TPA: hypothetical protein VFI11_01980 [Anaerolineales bacterium]|nr:hypothetical protein [Anaerolineales bacterium]